MAGINEDCKSVYPSQEAGRQKVCDTLRHRARRLHTLATQLDILADFVTYAPVEVDAIVYQLLSDSPLNNV